MQLNTDEKHIYQYGKPIISEDQENIRLYLKLRFFSTATTEIKEFLFKESYHLEQTAALMACLREYLKTNHILEPAQY